MSLTDPAARLRRSTPPLDPADYPPPAGRSPGWGPPGSSAGRALALLSRGKLAALPPSVPEPGGAAMAVCSAGGMVAGPVIPTPAEAVSGLLASERGGDSAGRTIIGSGARRLRPPERAASVLLPWALALAHGAVDAAPLDALPSRVVVLSMAPATGSWAQGPASLRLTSQDWDLLKRAVDQGGAGWRTLSGPALESWARALLTSVFEADALNPVDAP
jgi:hypothetical protein